MGADPERHRARNLSAATLAFREDEPRVPASLLFARLAVNPSPTALSHGFFGWRPGDIENELRHLVVVLRA
jgi:hypothetical protein